MLRIHARATRTIATLALAAALLGLTGAAAAQAETIDAYKLGGYLPFTPWLRPPIRLPAVPTTNFQAEAEKDIGTVWHWSDGRGWYCTFLHCAHGPYGLATIWSEVHLFQAVDALQIAAPSARHRALVRHFARENERYWDRRLKGFAPYPGDRGGGVRAFFDDNGWEGLAFFEAFKATGEQRWLVFAQRAFHFIAAHGWRRRGGMWWNTWHPSLSGPALAADTLLGTLLFFQDHQHWQIKDVLKYVNWANAHDAHDERRFYLAQPNHPNSTLHYIDAPLIYAQQLLCEHGYGYGYCVRAGRVAATIAEEDERNKGGVREYVYNYGPQFDEIFMQWMLAYGRATGVTFWQHLVELNAAAAAANARNAAGLYLGSWWGGPFLNTQTLPAELQTAGSTAALLAWTAVYAKGVY